MVRLQFLRLNGTIQRKLTLTVTSGLSLFSKFTLSSDGVHHMRIKSATLDGADSTTEIETAREDSSPPTVSPSTSSTQRRSGC